MATFNDYWRRLTRRSPELSVPGVVVRYTAPQVKKQLQKAYEQGAKDGSRFREDVSHLAGDPTKNPGGDFFDMVCGKRGT